MEPGGSGQRRSLMRTTSRVLLAGALLIGLSACAQPTGPEGSGTKSSQTVSAAESRPSHDAPETTGRAMARWTYEEGFKPTATSWELRVRAMWVGCASGAAPVDPQPVVGYSSNEVSVAVWAIPPVGEAFTCQGNSSVKLRIPLKEPLGSRDVVPGPGQVR
jgi:hypothetical protein